MNEVDSDGNDLGDMLTELRVLLTCSQLFTAFLITLPFSSGFSKIVKSEKSIFLATFVCSIVSLVLFTAPAVQHRLMRPLMNRRKFKRLSSAQMIFGAAALSGALVLGADLVIEEVFGHILGMVVASVIGILISILWWLLPLVHNKKNVGVKTENS
jgi:hypothetical protein